MNWKVRFHNPTWWLHIALAIIVPILSYMGLNVQDLTSWHLLGKVVLEALGNPYVLGLVLVSVWNACIDPTTKGVCDSARAMTYDKPQ